jgi:preprotein translocase subunit SecB
VFAVSPWFELGFLVWNICHPRVWVQISCSSASLRVLRGLNEFDPNHFHTTINEESTFMSEQQEAPSFSIEKLYLKDLSVEVPNAPAIFLEPDSPQVEIQLQTNAQALGDGAYEVTLTVTVTARIEDKTVFLVEVGQAGIFRIQNVPDENLEPLIAVACPNILFPYAREVVSDAVTRAGFSPVVLQPVNFEGMYMARMQEAQAQAAASPHEVPIQ